MENEQYIQIFNKVNKRKNIHGINFELIRILSAKEANAVNEVLVFNIINNNDLSYTKITLEQLLLDQIEKFNRLFSLWTFCMTENVMILDAKEIHIGSGDNLKTEITNTLKKTKELKSGFYTDSETGEKVYDLVHIKPKRWGVDIEGDFIQIINYVEPIDMYQVKKNDNEIVGKLNIKDELPWSYSESFNGSYDEHELNYLEMDDVFENYPLVMDGEWQACYVVTEFINI